MSKKFLEEGYEEMAEVRGMRCARARTDFGWLRSRIEWETGEEKDVSQRCSSFSRFLAHSTISPIDRPSSALLVTNQERGHRPGSVNPTRLH